MKYTIQSIDNSRQHIDRRITGMTMTDQVQLKAVPGLSVTDAGPIKA